MQSSQVRNVGLPSSAESRREYPAWTQDPKIFPLDWFSVSRPNIIRQTKEYVSELSKWRNCPKIKTLSKLKGVMKRIMMFLHTHTSYIDGKSLLECDVEEDLITLVSLYMDMELRVLLIKKSTANGVTPNNASGPGLESGTNMDAERTDKQVADRISYWMYTVLTGHEQRIDALLSATVYSRHTRPVLDPLFRKILSEMSDGPFSNVNYVRHMLAYKTWRERALFVDDAASEELNVRVLQQLVPRDYAFPSPLLRCLGKGDNARDHARPHNVNLADACRNFIRFCREMPAAAAEQINFGCIPLLDDDMLGDEENEVNKLMNMISDRKQRKSALLSPRSSSLQVDAFIDLTLPTSRMTSLSSRAIPSTSDSDIIDLTEEDEKPVRRSDSPVAIEPAAAETPPPEPVVQQVSTSPPQTYALETTSSPQVETRCFTAYRDQDIYLVNISCMCPVRNHRQECQCQDKKNVSSYKENKVIKSSLSESSKDATFVGRCFQFSIRNRSQDTPETRPPLVVDRSQEQVKLEMRSSAAVTCNTNQDEVRVEAQGENTAYCDKKYSSNLKNCDCDACKRRNGNLSYENRTSTSAESRGESASNGLSDNSVQCRHKPLVTDTPRVPHPASVADMYAMEKTSPIMLQSQPSTSRAENVNQFKHFSQTLDKRKIQFSENNSQINEISKDSLIQSEESLTINSRNQIRKIKLPVSEGVLEASTNTSSEIYENISICEEPASPHRTEDNFTESTGTDSFTSDDDPTESTNVTTATIHNESRPEEYITVEEINAQNETALHMSDTITILDDSTHQLSKAEEKIPQTKTSHVSDTKAEIERLCSEITELGCSLISDDRVEDKDEDLLHKELFEETLSSETISESALVPDITTEKNSEVFSENLESTSDITHHTEEASKLQTEHSDTCQAQLEETVITDKLFPENSEQTEGATEGKEESSNIQSEQSDICQVQSENNDANTDRIETPAEETPEVNRESSFQQLQETEITDAVLPQSSELSEDTNTRTEKTTESYSFQSKQSKNCQTQLEETVITDLTEDVNTHHIDIRTEETTEVNSESSNYLECEQPGEDQLEETVVTETVFPESLQPTHDVIAHHDIQTEDTTEINESSNYLQSEQSDICEETVINDAICPENLEPTQNVITHQIDVRTEENAVINESSNYVQSGQSDVCEEQLEETVITDAVYPENLEPTQNVITHHIDIQTEETTAITESSDVCEERLEETVITDAVCPESLEPTHDVIAHHIDIQTEETTEINESSVCEEKLEETVITDAVYPESLEPTHDVIAHHIDIQTEETTEIIESSDVCEEHLEETVITDAVCPESLVPTHDVIAHHIDIQTEETTEINESSVGEERLEETVITDAVCPENLEPTHDVIAHHIDVRTEKTSENNDESSNYLQPEQSGVCEEQIEETVITDVVCPERFEPTQDVITHQIEETTGIHNESCKSQQSDVCEEQLEETVITDSVCSESLEQTQDVIIQHSDIQTEKTTEINESSNYLQSEQSDVCEEQLEETVITDSIDSESVEQTQDVTIQHNDIQTEVIDVESSNYLQSEQTNTCEEPSQDVIDTRTEENTEVNDEPSNSQTKKSDICQAKVITDTLFSETSKTTENLNDTSAEETTDIHEVSVQSDNCQAELEETVITDTVSPESLEPTEETTEPLQSDICQTELEETVKTDAAFPESLESNNSTEETKEILEIPCNLQQPNICQTQIQETVITDTVITEIDTRTDKTTNESNLQDNDNLNNHEITKDEFNLPSNENYTSPTDSTQVGFVKELAPEMELVVESEIVIESIPEVAASPNVLHTTIDNQLEQQNVSSNTELPLEQPNTGKQEEPLTVPIETEPELEKEHTDLTEINVHIEKEKCTEQELRSVPVETKVHTDQELTISRGKDVEQKETEVHTEHHSDTTATDVHIDEEELHSISVEKADHVEQKDLHTISSEIEVRTEQEELNTEPIETQQQDSEEALQSISVEKDGHVKQEELHTLPKETEIHAEQEELNSAVNVHQDEPISTPNDDHSVEKDAQILHEESAVNNTIKRRISIVADTQQKKITTVAKNHTQNGRKLPPRKRRRRKSVVDESVYKNKIEEENCQQIRNVDNDVLGPSRRRKSTSANEPILAIESETAQEITISATFNEDYLNYDNNPNEEMSSDLESVTENLSNEPNSEAGKPKRRRKQNLKDIIREDKAATTKNDKSPIKDKELYIVCKKLSQNDIDVLRKSKVDTLPENNLKLTATDVHENKTKLKSRNKRTINEFITFNIIASEPAPEFSDEDEDEQYERSLKLRPKNSVENHQTITLTKNLEEVSSQLENTNKEKEKPGKIKLKPKKKSKPVNNHVDNIISKNTEDSVENLPLKSMEPIPILKIKRARGRPPKIVSNKLKFFSENFNLQNLDSKNGKFRTTDNNFSEAKPEQEINSSHDMSEEDIPLVYRMSQSLTSKRNSSKPQKLDTLSDVENKYINSEEDLPLSTRKQKLSPPPPAKTVKSYSAFMKSDKLSTLNNGNNSKIHRESITKPKSFRNKLEQFKYQPNNKTVPVEEDLIEEEETETHPLTEINSKNTVRTCSNTKPVKTPELFSVPYIFQPTVKPKKSILKLPKNAATKRIEFDNHLKVTYLESVTIYEQVLFKDTDNGDCSNTKPKGEVYHIKTIKIKYNDDGNAPRLCPHTPHIKTKFKKLPENMSINPKLNNKCMEKPKLNNCNSTRAIEGTNGNLTPKIKDPESEDLSTVANDDQIVEKLENKVDASTEKSSFVEESNFPPKENIEETKPKEKDISNNLNKSLVTESSDCTNFFAENNEANTEPVTMNSHVYVVPKKLMSKKAREKLLLMETKNISENKLQEKIDENTEANRTVAIESKDTLIDTQVREKSSEIIKSEVSTKKVEEISSQSSETTLNTVEESNNPKIDSPASVEFQDSITEKTVAENISFVNENLEEAPKIVKSKFPKLKIKISNKNSSFFSNKSRNNFKSLPKFKPRFSKKKNNIIQSQLDRSNGRIPSTLVEEVRRIKKFRKSSRVTKKYNKVDSEELLGENCKNGSLVAAELTVKSVTSNSAVNIVEPFEQISSNNISNENMTNCVITKSEELTNTIPLKKLEQNKSDCPIAPVLDTTENTKDKIESAKIENKISDMVYKPSNKIYEKEFDFYSDQDDASNSELVIDTSAESSDAEEPAADKQIKEKNHQIQTPVTKRRKYHHSIAEIVNLNEKSVPVEDEFSAKVQDHEIKTSEATNSQTLNQVPNDNNKFAETVIIQDNTIDHQKNNVHDKVIDLSISVQDETVGNKLDVENITIPEVPEEAVHQNEIIDLRVNKKIILEEHTAEITKISEEIINELETEAMIEEKGQLFMELHAPSVEMLLSIELGLETYSLSQEPMEKHAKEGCIKCSVNGKHKDNKRVTIRGVHQYEQSNAEECLEESAVIPAIPYCQAVESFEPNLCTFSAKEETAKTAIENSSNIDNYNLCFLADIAMNSIHLSTKSENNNFIEMIPERPNENHHQSPIRKDERCIYLTFLDNFPDSNKPTTSVSVYNTNNEEISVNVQKMAGGLNPKGVILENKIQALTERAKNGTKVNGENLDELYTSLENICELEINTLTKPKPDDQNNVPSIPANPKIPEQNITIDIPNTALLHLSPDDDDYMIRNVPFSLQSPPAQSLPEETTSKAAVTENKADYDSTGVVKKLCTVIESLTKKQKLNIENENSKKEEEQETKTKSRKGKSKSKTSNSPSSDTSYLLNKYKNNHDSNKQAEVNNQPNSNNTSPLSYIRSTRPMRMVTTRKRNANILDISCSSDEPPKKVSASEKMFDKLLEEHRKELSKSKDDTSEEMSIDTSAENSCSVQDSMTAVDDSVPEKNTTPAEELNIPLPVLNYQMTESNAKNDNAEPTKLEKSIVIVEETQKEDVHSPTEKLQETIVNMEIEKPIEKSKENSLKEKETVNENTSDNTEDKIETEEQIDKEKEEQVVVSNTTNRNASAIEVVKDWFNRVDDNKQQTNPYIEITYQTIEECTFFDESSSTSENSPNVRKTDDKVFGENKTPDSGIAFDEDSAQKDKSVDFQISIPENLSDGEVYCPTDPGTTKTYFCNVGGSATGYLEKVTISNMHVVQPDKSTKVGSMRLKVSIALERIHSLLPTLRKLNTASPERKTKGKKRKYNSEEINSNPIAVDDFNKSYKRRKHSDDDISQDCIIEEVVSTGPNQKDVAHSVRSKGSVKEYPDCLFGITESPVPSGSFNSPYPSDISLTEEPAFYEEGGIDLCNDYPCYDSFEVLQEQQSLQKEYNVVDDNPKDVQQGLQAGYCVVDSQFLPLSEYMNDGDYILIDNKIFNDKRMVPVNMHQVQPETKPHNTEEVKRSEFDDSEKEDSLSETVDEIIKNPELFSEQSASEVHLISMDQATSEVQVVIACDTNQDTEMTDTYLFGIALQNDTTSTSTVSENQNVALDVEGATPESKVTDKPVIKPATPVMGSENTQFCNSSVVPVADVPQPVSMEVVTPVDPISKPVITQDVNKPEDLSNTAIKLKSKNVKSNEEKEDDKNKKSSTSSPNTIHPSSPKPCNSSSSKSNEQLSQNGKVVENKTSKTTNHFISNILNKPYKNSKKPDYPQGAIVFNPKIPYPDQRPHVPIQNPTIPVQYLSPPPNQKPYYPKTYNSTVPIDAFDKLKQDRPDITPPHTRHRFPITNSTVMRTRYRKDPSPADFHRRHSSDRDLPRMRHSSQVPHDLRRPHSAYTEPSPKPAYRLPPSDPTYRSSQYNSKKTDVKMAQAKSVAEQNKHGPGPSTSHKDWLNNETLLNLIKTANTLYNKKY